MRTLVVTPTLGESPWLTVCVDSVALLPPECRHVLVTAAARVDELQRRFPHTRVVVEPPGGRGMYAALNSGVTAADEWDAFTYLNDDDLLLPGISAAVRRLDPHAGAPMIAYGRVDLVGADGRRLGAIPVSPWPALNRELYRRRIEPVYQHGTLITRRAWLQLGGFDERLRFCGDSELLARACVQRIPFLRVPGAPVAAFRLRAGQLTKNRPAMQAERARVDEQLGLLRGPSRGGGWAKVLFRLANLPVYAGRVARHGFIAFDELLERGG